MKKYLTIIVTLFAVVVLKAQVPQGINYQAIVRDAGGSPRAGEDVVLFFRLAQAGTTIFTETHTVTTNDYGLVNVVIGGGTTNSGDFSSIPWENGQITVAVFVDGDVIATSPLQSVPYAMHCATADALSGGGTSPWSVSGSDVYYNTGRVGMGTDAPQTLLHLVGGGLLATGSSGTTPISGSGTRFMWIPSKQAIRAGSIIGTEWDDANIGSGSAAFGSNNTASGSHSTSFGQANTASGTRSFSAGVGSFASGNGSTAFGEYAHAGGRAEFSVGAYPLNDGVSTAFATMFEVGNGSSDANRSTAFIVNYAGNVGIGTTTPANKLDVEGGVAIGTTYSGTSAAPVNGLIVQGNVGIGTSALTAGSKLEVVGSTRLAGDLNIDSSTPTLRWRTAAGVQQAFIQHTGSLFIDASVGNIRIGGSNFFIDKTNNRVGIGTLTPSQQFHVVGNIASGYVATIENQNTGTNADGLRILLNNTVTSIDYIQFQRTGGLVQGRIAANGSGAVSYLTASDMRLKENIKNLENGLDLVLLMQPRKYVFKTSPNYERIGFIAQELKLVFPEAVNGDETGDVSESPMMIDYSKLTPLLTKAIQEQQLLIEENQQQIQLLQEEINALKRQ